MITLHTAIFALDPKIKVIRGEDAFDENENPIPYDLVAAQAKLAELQAAQAQAEQAAAAAKQSASTKLTALGLTQAEITALIG